RKKAQQCEDQLKAKLDQMATDRLRSLQRQQCELQAATRATREVMAQLQQGLSQGAAEPAHLFASNIKLEQEMKALRERYGSSSIVISAVVNDDITFRGDAKVVESLTAAAELRESGAAVAAQSNATGEG